MQYKPDWPEARQRMLAWWEGELVDRAVIQVTAPRDNAAGDSLWDPFYLVNNLDNPELAFEQWEKYCRDTLFAGEMIPNLWVNLGPGIPAAFLGARLRKTADTVWFEPPGDLSLDDILATEFDSAGDHWWRTTMDLTEEASSRAEGRYFCGITDLNSVFDILCHLRGTQRVLYDMMDTPDKVKQVTGRINRIWLDTADNLLDIVTSRQEGSAWWMNIWCPGRGTDVQCDFSAMLSPEMFEEFVIPHLVEEIRNAEHTIFHLDGPGQLPHLELLLDIPELDGIQWIPGAGNPGTGSPRWFPMYRRILEKGKRLVIQGMDRGDVQGVLDNISGRGVLIETTCDSEQQAIDLLDKVGQWTRD